jgi:hypothetical protein
MEPHLLPNNIGSLVNVKNDLRVRRRMEAFGFWPVYVTPHVITYRRDFANRALYTYGYDPMTDSEPCNA